MTTGRWTDIQGVKVPRLIYGTAWKEEETTRLTALALEAGFRGIDTANQRRHYHEAGIGEALRQARIDDVFVQTKFTHLDGQDERLPYDRDAAIGVQVAQSVDSSLGHLEWRSSTRT
jgi:diketogulonate reductase-like aldo/keto reductase